MQLGRGVTARELALRYRCPLRTLTAQDETTCFAVWSCGEAGLFELASIYRVAPKTMLGALRRLAKAECLRVESRHASGQGAQKETL